MCVFGVSVNVHTYIYTSIYTICTHIHKDMNSLLCKMKVSQTIAIYNFMQNNYLQLYFYKNHVTFYFSVKTAVMLKNSHFLTSVAVSLVFFMLDENVSLI